MARKKVVRKYIPHNPTCRETFQKHSRGMMKKAGEVATMSNTKAYIIVYGKGDLMLQVFPPHEISLWAS